VETRHRLLSFDRFELDLSRYELRRAGRRIPLQRVPMEILILLVEKEGALASRDEIVARVWSAHVQVDTEHSINTAVRKIRLALHDDPGRPRFVETVVGKGYRFVAPVASVEPGAPTPPTPPPVAEPPRLPPPRRWRVPGPAPLVAPAALALVAVALVTPWSALPPVRSGQMRLVPFTALPGAESGPAFSPDGNQIVFAWSPPDAGVQHLYVKSVGDVQTVGAGTPRELTDGTDPDSDPAWSPDGRWIAFLRQDAASRLALAMVSAAGGPVRTLRVLSGKDLFRPAWSADSSALAVMDSGENGAGIFRVSAETGQATHLTSTAASVSGDWAPAFSRDGRMLAFARNGGSALTGILYLMDVDRAGFALGQPRTVATDRVDFTSLEWSSDSRTLIAGTRAGLVEVPASGGPAAPLPFPDASQPSVSRRSNRLVFVQSVRDTDIYRVPGPDGSDPIASVVSSTRSDAAPAWSPDGRRIAFVSERTGSEQIWLADSDGRHPQQLTFLARGAAGCPRWSPDARRIAFDSTEQGRANIYVIDVASGVARRVISGDSTNVRPSWSRDGASIYFGSNRSGSWDVWKTTPEGRDPVQVTRGGGREAFEDLEGRFVYYTRERAVPGIWRVPASGGAAEPVTPEGAQGRWTIGQRGLYYATLAGGLEFLDFPTRRRVPIATPGLRLGASFGGMLAVGPQDRSILVTVLMRADSDLTLVENFSPPR
jgi:Tol biopolymer transport system component/DNA-binding winged helix-turn-helix (wHTH) protein